MEAEMG